ncbi:glutaredoxin family protein [Leifsonia sp. NPDC058292]|uniref:glutaredoxin family protein n=1 Tax=Leifsonia sp. NPDC058292 TaxID=3346428 RepID=UPI0036DE1E60
MSTHVTLYVESGSATSDKTRAAMDSAGIAYELVLVTADDYPLQAVGTSYATAPVTVVDGTSWDGYRPDLIARLATEQALEAYEVPVDPMIELQCESCQ